MAALVRGYNRLLVALQAQHAQDQALREAGDAAEAASRAKSLFLTQMSHEIRTPMNGILGLAQLLAAPQVDDAQRQAWAQALLGSGQALMRLLGDVLTLVQAEANQLDLAREPLAPAELLDEVRNAGSAQAQSLGLRLQVLWQADPAQRYLGDAARLRQMIDHLLRNAFKFSPHGGAISVRAQEVQREAAVATLRFAVQDEGPGVSAAQWASLFQPFAAGPAGQTHRPGGAGLGLALVKRLAQAMGGGVRVESPAGHGACFSFTVLLQTLPALGAARLHAGPASGAGPVAPEAAATHDAPATGSASLSCESGADAAHPPAPLAGAPVVLSAALRAQWQAGLRELAPLLQAHRYDALVELQALQTLTDQTPLAADCAALGLVLQRLDFDQAAAWVQAQLASAEREHG